MSRVRLHSFLRQNGIYLLVGTSVLLLGMVIGYITPKGTEPISSDPLFASIEQWVQFYVPYTPLTVLFLFAKNTLTAAISFFLAPIIIVPPGILLLNGFTIGFFGSAIAAQDSLLLAFEALAPHGIFEIPALVFAAAGGMRFGVAIYRKIVLSVKNIDYSVRSEFRGSIWLFVIAVVLLLIAAIMETYVTPFILGYVPG